MRDHVGEDGESRAEQQQQKMQVGGIMTVTTTVPQRCLRSPIFSKVLLQLNGQAASKYNLHRYGGLRNQHATATTTIRMSQQQSTTTTPTTSSSSSVAQTIQNKLTEAFQPTHLEVRNESHMHNVPLHSETHFKVLVVSSHFEGITPINQHRNVNTVLAHELQHGVHALSIVTKTPQQWQVMQQQGQTIDPSPKCRGGDGSLPSK